jgi:hypothetical protein
MTIEPVDALAAPLNKLRPLATIAISRRSASSPREALDVFVASLGLQAIGEGWRQLNKHEAKGFIPHARLQPARHYAE